MMYDVRRTRCILQVSGAEPGKAVALCRRFVPGLGGQAGKVV